MVLPMIVKSVNKELKRMTLTIYALANTLITI